VLLQVETEKLLASESRCCWRIKLAASLSEAVSQSMSAHDSGALLCHCPDTPETAAFVRCFVRWWESSHDL